MKKSELINRREFLKKIGIAGAGVVLTSCGLGKTAAQDQTNASPLTETSANTITPLPENTQGMLNEAQTPTPTAFTTFTPAHLSVARGASPSANVIAVMAALGGMERFVKNGADVIIKPNICTNYYPFEYAATTNPEVVATLVQLCWGAGAKRVRVLDYPFGGTSQSAYEMSGIASAVAQVGGEMEVINPHKFVMTEIPDGQDISEWLIYKDVLEVDTLINVPIAKHHGLARLTLGAKNLLGVIENRGGIHRNLTKRIADLVSRIRPHLTVIDATRVLMDNGPTGGNLNDVRQMDTIIASHDIVCADSYAATLFGLKGSDIGYISDCAERGLGLMDFSSIRIEEIST